MNAAPVPRPARRLWYWRWLLRGEEPPCCLGCGGPLELRTFAACHARGGSVRIAAYGLPYRACATGCADRRFPGTGFARRLRTAIFESAGVPVARAGASGEPHCCRCVSRQWDRGSARHAVQGTVELEGLPRFELALTGPARSCASCGCRQIVPTERFLRDLNDALARLWEAAGFRSRFRRHA